jgi:hypothetical protein
VSSSHDSDQRTPSTSLVGPTVKTVREGSSGILYLTDGSDNEQMFVPNYDMDAAVQLLREFQQLKQLDGPALAVSYRVGNHNWYPAMVSYLFWYVFFPYVKYLPLVCQYSNGEIEFRWENTGMFRGLIEVLEARTKSNFKTRIHYWLVKWNNRLVAARRRRATVLYFSFGRNDFRSKEIKETLDELGCRFIEVLPRASFRKMLGNMFGGADYYYGREPVDNKFGYHYQLNDLTPEKKMLFQAAIQVVERSITSYLVEYNDHLEALQNSDARVFYGLDDINGYIFPLLYACRDRGIRTVGHQHGAYVKRHVGYMMPGIARQDFVWLDRLVVWGEYWKEKLLRESEVHRRDSIIVGANKFRQTYRVSASNPRSPKNILVPYEFLTNTFKVGQYIQRLIDLGYHVFFKPRPDEPISEQLDAYCLPAKIRERLTIVTNLDEATLQNIDIVAGTMTSLIYELLPCRKIVWIFETEYRHLEDLVEEGWARKVRYENVETLDDTFFVPTEVPTEKLFGAESLKAILEKQVVNAAMEN